jgi:putative sterol carrier protein
MNRNAAADLAKAAETVFTKPFGGLIRLETDKDETPLWIDGRRAPPQASWTAPGDADGAPLCVWRASRETLQHLLEGERLLAGAFVSGRLSIAGDMSIMARLQLERGPRA